MEEAKAYQALLDRGWTREELAQKLGFTQVWRIEERTSLLNLVPEYQQMLVAGQLTSTQAFHTSRLPQERQPAFVKCQGALNFYPLWAAKTFPLSFLFLCALRAEQSRFHLFLQSI
jgi:transcriptional regulator with XRE-family HTH domain